MTTIKGMKYESADVSDIARFISDDRWSMEQKADGIRCIVHVSTAGTSLLSHTGEVLKSGVKHHGKVKAAFFAGLTDSIFDGELLIDGSLWLFDVMKMLGTDTRSMPQSERRALLDHLALTGMFSGTVVHILPAAHTAADKAALWTRIIAESAEGVVVKRRTAHYATDGSPRRSKDVLKIKVTRTIDVVVTARNTDGHENAELGLYATKTSGVPQLVPVGACSMIGKANAQPGDVIEVQFLYVVDPADPRLYQPRMMRLRDDKPAVECDIAQLIGCTVSKEVLAS